MRITLAAALAALAALAAAQPAAAAGYGAQNASETCGFLPYRTEGADRFAGGRTDPPATATIGPQATYPFAWDLARPAFLAAEVAEDLLAGKPPEAVAGVHGGALSLGEYMLFAANKFEARPAPSTSTDVRVALAAERPMTFHLIYAHAKTAYEAVVAELQADAPDPAALAPVAISWRPAYALVAKAQADDKRIELLATDLSTDAVAEKEAVACLAHAVAALAGDADATARAQASAARWATRPGVDARGLDRSVRAAFFDYEDAGDDLASAIRDLPASPTDDDAMRAVAKSYAAFVTAAKSLHEARRRLAQ